jgi:hypothetical protein
MTAICWTRTIYIGPTLANKIWKRWRASKQNAHRILDIPQNIPKN